MSNTNLLFDYFDFCDSFAIQEPEEPPKKKKKSKKRHRRASSEENHRENSSEHEDLSASPIKKCKSDSNIIKTPYENDTEATKPKKHKKSKNKAKSGE